MKKILEFNNAIGVTLVELLVGIALLSITGLMVASLAISLNKSVLQNQVDSVISEMASDMLYKISVKGVCDFNFAGENATQASVGNITDATGTTIYSVGMSTGSGFTISAMSLAQINSTRADLTVKFTRSSTTSVKALEVSRNIRLTTVPNSVTPTIIDSCSFSITSATEDLIHYACNGEGAIYDDNETPADTTDDKCVWAGYSVEQCPATERISRFELVNIPDGAGKMLPMYRPVCVTVNVPKSLTCASGKFLVGYNSSSNQIICRRIKYNDIIQHFNGILSDCSSGSTYPIAKVLDNSIYNINIACTPIPTGTPTSTPTAGVYELRFGTPAITGTNSYSFQLFRDGVAVSVATATAFPLKALVIGGPCTSSNNIPRDDNGCNGLPPAVDNSSFVWTANPKICSPVASNGSVINYGIIGKVYSDQNLTNVLASTACLPIITSGTPTATPTASPTNTPVPSSTPTPGPGTNTATPTPTATPTSGPCTMSGTYFFNDGSIDEVVPGTFTIDATVPASGVRAVQNAGFLYKAGDFESITSLDSVPSMNGAYSTLTSVESENINASQHEFSRFIRFQIFITYVYPGPGTFYYFAALGSNFYRRDYPFTKDDPACTGPCNYSGATIHTNNPSYGGCWASGASSKVYYRIKRVGNVISVGCGTAAIPNLTTSFNIGGCYMDTGLYLGASFEIRESASGSLPDLYPMPTGEISPNPLQMGGSL